MPYDDSSVKATRRSQVSEQCDGLTESIESLFKAIEDLQQRLESILQQEPSAIKQHNLEQPSPGGLVTHAAFLQGRNEQIRRAIGRIQSIRERLEI